MSFLSVWKNFNTNHESTKNKTPKFNKRHGVQEFAMIRSMNIAWWVQRWADLNPDKPAIIFEGEKITYSELNRRANRASCWLQSLGIEKGDRVAAILSNCPQFLELFLACARLGAIFVPLNFRSAAA